MKPRQRDALVIAGLLLAVVIILWLLSRQQALIQPPI